MNTMTVCFFVVDCFAGFDVPRFLVFCGVIVGVLMAGALVRVLRRGDKP